eukprot:gene55886-76605_t
MRSRSGLASTRQPSVARGGRENWSGGVRLTTGSATDPLSSNQTLGTYNNRYTVLLDRAYIRKLGIRFGAYHIFMPALLKPAPAELITLLWALKNDALDKPGYGELIPVLAAGRTSVVTDNSFERNFYRLA